MPPTINDVIRVVAKLSQAGNDIQNVFHVKVNGTTPPGTNALLLGGIAAFLDDAYTNIATRIANNVTFDSIWAHNMTKDEYVGETDWPTLTAGGGGTEPMMPPQTAPLVLFRTSEPKSLGKKFLPVMSSLQLEDDGSIVATGLTQIALFAADVLAGYSAGTWQLQAGNFRPVTGAFLGYLSSAVRDLFATQRRRYTGRGT